jgi:hypothetical protein
MEEFPMKLLVATLVSSSAHAQYGVWRSDYRAYAQVPPAGFEAQKELAASTDFPPGE